MNMLDKYMEGRTPMRQGAIKKALTEGGQNGQLQTGKPSS
jgi:hypothetical protein